MLVLAAFESSFPIRSCSTATERAEMLCRKEQRVEGGSSAVCQGSSLLPFEAADGELERESPTVETKELARKGESQHRRKDEGGQGGSFWEAVFGVEITPKTVPRNRATSDGPWLLSRLHTGSSAPFSI